VRKDPASLALLYLRSIDAKIDGVRADLRDVGHRLTSIEAVVLRLHDALGDQASRTPDAPT
jgi:hypothetical protein